jgi:hypothetical protein
VATIGATMRTTCPLCMQNPGQPCVSMGTGKPIDGFHFERRRAAGPNETPVYRYLVIDEMGVCKGTGDMLAVYNALAHSQVFDTATSRFVQLIDGHITECDPIKEYIPQ